MCRLGVVWFGVVWERNGEVGRGVWEVGEVWCAEIEDAEKLYKQEQVFESEKS